jgi:hydrogenase nickel incorporation protein HypA/HybF
MHEQSLVRSLLSQVQNDVVPNASCRVDEVRVEIGPLAGVEPLLVQSAFEQLVESSSLRGARLVIDVVPLSAECTACAEEFDVERFRFRCPACGSPQVRVTRGDAFRLVSITIREGVPLQEVES